MYNFFVKLSKFWPILLVGFTAWITEDLWLKGFSSQHTLSNILEAKDVKISSKVNARIKQIFIKEGDLVKKGQILLIFDGDDIQAQYEQSKANTKKAEYELIDLTKGARKQEIISAELDTKKNQELLDQAVSKLENAEADFKRASELYKEGALSKQAYDKALADKVWSEKEVKSREKSLQSISQSENLVKEGPRKDKVSAYRAQLEFFIAKERELKDYADELTITSPLEGEISNFDLKEGELIKPNQVIATITDLSDIYVRVYVPPSLLPKLKLRDNVRIVPDGLNDKVFYGKISYIGAQAEFTPRNIQTIEERTKLVYPVKIQIENKDSILKDGMYVTVEL